MSEWESKSMDSMDVYDSDMEHRRVPWMCESAMDVYDNEKVETYSSEW